MKSIGTLKGCQVLLVRPENTPDKTQALLTEKQAEVFHYPVMSIRYLAPEAIQAVLERSAKPEKVIFTSRNAVEGIARYRHPGEIFGLAECFAIGPSTADSLARLGIPASMPRTTMSSEGLLELPSLACIEGQTVYLVKGVGGRTHLEEQLRKRVAHLVICEVYWREREESNKDKIISFLKTAARPVIFLHSGELMTNLLGVAGKQWISEYYQIPVVVPGGRIAQMARDSGFKEVLVASSALADSMVSVTEEWYS